MKNLSVAGLLAMVAIACLFACARAAEAAQTPVTSPLVLTCSTAKPGDSVAPWPNCANGMYQYKPPAADLIVATDSTTTGTWQLYGGLAVTRLIRTCPQGASISTDLKQCLNAAGTSSAMAFLSKSIIETGNVLASGSARLTWVAPTANTDASALVDLAGFSIYAALSSPPTQKVADVGAGVLTYNVTNLAPGIWFFGVKARNAAGIESDLSGVATKTVENPTPPTLTFSVAPSDGVERVTPRIVWSSSNTTQCSASGAWEGTKAISGDEVLPPISRNATYQLVCTGPGGEARAAAAVVVSSRPGVPTQVTVE